MGRRETAGADGILLGTEPIGQWPTSLNSRAWQGDRYPKTVGRLRKPIVVDGLGPPSYSSKHSTGSPIGKINMVRESPTDMGNSGLEILSRLSRLALHVGNGAF